MSVARLPRPLMRRRFLRWGALGLVAGLVWAFAMPQSDGGKVDETDTIAIMKANFLFHFAAANDWPEEVKVGTFRIGVVGNDRLVEELVDKYAMKPIRQQVLEIVPLKKKDVAVGPPDPFCHVLYVEAGQGDLGVLSEALHDSPTMLVSHEAAGLSKGALINFVTQANRLRFSIDQEEAKRRKLLIGNKILSWAVADE
jgi:hypothetical protein